MSSAYSDLIVSFDMSQEILNSQRFKVLYDELTSEIQDRSNKKNPDKVKL